MFPINLIRHLDPELFFAVISPVGADVAAVCEGLDRVLNRFKYRLHTIRVIEELKGVKSYLENESDYYDKKLENRMNEGDRFRKETNKDEALALLAFENVRNFRRRKNRDREAQRIERQAYLFRSLK